MSVATFSHEMSVACDIARLPFLFRWYCNQSCLSDTAAPFEMDTMSCLGMVKKTWRLRSEVRFDEVHFEQFHVDWQNSHLVHCMSVWWICWKQFHSNSLFLISSLYLLDLKLHSSRKILVLDCACTVARRSCGSFGFNQNSLRS